MQDMKNDLCLKLRLGSHGVRPIRKCPVVRFGRSPDVRTNAHAQKLVQA